MRKEKPQLSFLENKRKITVITFRRSNIGLRLEVKPALDIDASKSSHRLFVWLKNRKIILEMWNDENVGHTDMKTI